VNATKIGRGGFFLPAVYKKAQRDVESALEEAEIDYTDLTQWNFPDEFLCFVLDMGLLDFVDRTYPNPRVNNEVPIWFLISCQFLMRLFQTGRYHHLRYLLNAGSLLTRFGFNVGTKKIGFNDKNKYERKTALDADRVRKFFKDTSPTEIRAWYCKDLQQWFKGKRALDSHGLFILDRSHLVVPDNPNYRDALKMPVDEHGQWYSNFSTLTQEQKKSLIYHPCYALSTLLNVAPNKTTFHIAGYELGPGNEDELTQAERLIHSFCQKNPGVIKELIVDRGYMSGEWIDKLKSHFNIDVLIPLRKNMQAYTDAIALAQMNDNWHTIKRQLDDSNKTQYKMEVCTVKEINLWGKVKQKIYATVSRCTNWDEKNQAYVEHFWVLASTKHYRRPELAVERYRLRSQTEERFRQLKHSWYITDFPSPHAALVESHVCFTLFTYSLLQLYLRRNDYQQKTKRLITTLRCDESMGKDAVLIYSKDKYGVMDLDDYTARVAGMQDSPRARLKVIMEAQKEARLKRHSNTSN